MDPSCAGSEAMWTVVIDTLSHRQQLTNALISAALFGVATCLAVASIYVLTAKRGDRRFSQSSALQLAATLVLYISTTTFTAAGFHAVFTTANQAEAAARALNDCDVEAFFNPVWLDALGDQMNCVQTATLIVNIVVGDAVVWWRVYMLWPRTDRKATRVILGASAMLLAATFALSVVDTCGACNFDLAFVQGEQGYGQLFSGATFGAAAAGMSLATNAIATCFTVYRAWTHVRSLRPFMRRLTLTEAEQILILVAESGFVYTAIWVIVVVWQVGENNSNVYHQEMNGRTFWGVTGYFVNGGLVPVIAIYPMFIIAMVALKRARTESTYMFSTHISFQPPGMTATSPRMLTCPSTPGDDRGSPEMSSRGLVARGSSEIGGSTNFTLIREIGLDDVGTKEPRAAGGGDPRVLEEV